MHVLADGEVNIIRKLLLGVGVGLIVISMVMAIALAWADSAVNGVLVTMMVGIALVWIAFFPGWYE